MKVYFCNPLHQKLRDWEKHRVELLREQYAKYRWPNIEVCGDPDGADLIVLLESNTYRDQHSIADLSKEPILRKYIHKTCSINHDQNPAGFLPGLYTGMNPGRIQVSKHIPWCYLFPTNMEIEKTAPDLRQRKPVFDYSFRGANSHSCRESIFKIEGIGNSNINRIDRWFDHSFDEKRSYIEDILNSRFVLCPRGISPSSHRLYEVMSLGRAPIIISDDWIKPPGVEWEAFALFVSEGNVAQIPALVKKHRSEWEERGFLARQYWEKHFSPAVRVPRAVNLLKQIINSGETWGSLAEAQSHWRGRSFYQRNDWLLRQRVVRKIKSFV